MRNSSNWVSSTMRFATPSVLPDHANTATSVLPAPCVEAAEDEEGDEDDEELEASPCLALEDELAEDESPLRDEHPASNPAPNAATPIEATAPKTVVWQCVPA